MKAILILLLGSVFAWDREYTLEEVHHMDTMEQFKAWSISFNRSYKSFEEESSKYLIWFDNLYKIGHYNSQNLTFKLRLNQFGDMTQDEFRHYVHGDDGACFKASNDIFKYKIGKHDVHDKHLSIDNDNPPSVDWTTKGVVTPVKNQGSCGSCWAFATTGTLECNYAIKTGILNSLSEQQLVDCSRPEGNTGCNGGRAIYAMNYTAKNGGLCSETEYPYTGKDGKCQDSECGTKYDANTGYVTVTPQSSVALETAAVAGCVQVGIEADQTAFQHYSSGVLTGTCGTSIDHVVLVVGYGTSGSQPYWKVKNSWSASWGMDGYVLICKDCNKNGQDGECGILVTPHMPTF